MLQEIPSNPTNVTTSKFYAFRKIGKVMALVLKYTQNIINHTEAHLEALYCNTFKVISNGFEQCFPQKSGFSSQYKRS